MAISVGLNTPTFERLTPPQQAGIPACCGYEIWEGWILSWTRTLMMGLESVLEMVVYVNHLVWPSTQENVIVPV
jgi:hypothetical protein